MITSFTNRLTSSNITHLLVTKIGTNQRIIIPINNSDLSEITTIESNKEESIFICRASNKKAMIISILDPHNPLVIDHDCLDYAFSDNSNELYAIRNKQFGIVNIANNTFNSLNDLAYKTCTGMKTNKTGNCVAICLDQQEIWIWQRNNKKFTKLFKNEHICNFCLHPAKDYIYIQYYDKPKPIYSSYRTIHGCPEIACIKIDTMEIKNLNTIVAIQSNGYAEFVEISNAFQFLPNSDDILFIGTPQKKDYFLNTKTNHLWSKEKNKSDQRMWFINNKDDNYERLTLTADCQQSIEQRRENNLILDILMFLIAKGKEEAPNLSPIKISLVPLIDNAVIEAVQKINKGFLPLSVIQKLKNQPANNPNDQTISPQMQKIIDASNTNNQWKWRWAKNIFYFVASCAAFILKVKPKWGKVDTSSAARSLAAMVIMGYCIERAIAQY